jgi:hypothetical protein
MARSGVVSKQFAPVPAALLLDERVSATMIAIYAAIRLHATFGENGGAYPGHRRIAELAHVSLATVKRDLATLRGCGWVTWRSRADEGLSNVYECWDEPNPMAQGEPTVAPTERGGSSQRAGGVAHPERQTRDSRTESPLPSIPEAAPSGGGKGYVSKAIDAWNASFGEGAAPAKVIAGHLGALVKAGHSEDLVLEAWGRFIASEASTFGPAYFRTRFSQYTTSTNGAVAAKVDAASDAGIARSAGQNVMQYRTLHGGEAGEWWQRVVRDAKHANRHPVALAWERIQREKGVVR